MEYPDYYHENQIDALPDHDECPECLTRAKWSRCEWRGVSSDGDEIEIDIYKCEKCSTEFEG